MLEPGALATGSSRLAKVMTSKLAVDPPSLSLGVLTRRSLLFNALHEFMKTRVVAQAVEARVNLNIIYRELASLI